MSQRWPHTGAILAGGESRRMGRPKASLPLAGGRTMIETVAETLGAVCRSVVIVGSADPASEGPSLRQIADLRPGQGPLAGIEALLASGLDTEFLVCPCDVPLVAAGLLARLTAPCGSLATVLRIGAENAFRPLPARLSAASLDRARAQLDRGERAVHAFIQSIDPHVVDIPREAADQLLTANTPEEYEALVKEGTRDEGRGTRSD